MLFFYPFLVLFMIGGILPLAIKNIENENTVSTIMIMLLVISLVIGGYVIGALLGFALIENKDEKTILNICVTPIKVEGYTIFKIIYSLVISIIGNIVIIGGLKIIATDEFVINYGGLTISLLDNLSWGKIVLFAIVNSLFVPMVALLISSFAKNKIEAFAIMKSGGIFVMIPVLVIFNFFQDAKQFILGIAPNFWAVKAMFNEALTHPDYSEPSNLNFYLYLLIGAIYLIFLSAICLRIFVKKINSN